MPLRHFIFIITVVVATIGCRTAGPLPADDLSAPGWHVRQGQAIWKTETGELAGELILATRPDGKASLQFIKTPLPLISAQTSGARWTVRFIVDNRTLSGKGRPPAQLLWLHLPPSLASQSVARPLEFKVGSGEWRVGNSKLCTLNFELLNSQTGEAISGFLTP